MPAVKGARHEPIPADFPVRPVPAGEPAGSPTTCGHCGLTWDDAIVTSWTPAPGARCPFEYFHIYRVRIKIVCLECGNKWKVGPNADPQCPRCNSVDYEVLE